MDNEDIDIDKSFKAIISTQQFIVNDLRNLKKEIDSIRSEMSSNYQGYAGWAQEMVNTFSDLIKAMFPKKV